MPLSPKDIAKTWLTNISLFSRIVARRPLHKYQLPPARAIVDSVLHNRGREFAILFPRQSGKNETAAQVIAYLLNLFQKSPGSQIVMVSPTFKPQSQNAKRRLETTLANDWNRGSWRSREGYIVQLGEALAMFFSAEPGANVVGATANVLLLCDEAQHVSEAIWTERFTPMAASSNATIVYLGTAWTSRTLLAKMISYLRTLEDLDGVQRVFVVGPELVAQANPAYGSFVARQVAKHGRNHPMVKTQYFNETIDAEGGMFPPARRALMLGEHDRRLAPGAYAQYALLLDVAGEDEGAQDEADLLQLANPRRDSTALTVVEIDMATVADDLLRAPTYRVVDRKTWIGAKHAILHAQIRALALHWRARFLVADATGVGQGLVSFLEKSLPGITVIPFYFTGASKSQLGWDFLSVCDTGRFKDHASATGHQPSADFWQQLEHCQYEILPGPNKTMRWGVPDGTRDPASGELMHDDLILSAALCAVLDEQDFAAYSPAQVQPEAAPLEKRRRGKF